MESAGKGSESELTLELELELERSKPYRNLDCEICGERLGVRDVWRKGAWFGRLCPDCEREGRRGVARSKAPV
jgi:hypothetical protein